MIRKHSHTLRHKTDESLCANTQQGGMAEPPAAWMTEASLRSRNFTFQIHKRKQRQAACWGKLLIYLKMKRKAITYDLLIMNQVKKSELQNIMEEGVNVSRWGKVKERRLPHFDIHFPLEGYQCRMCVKWKIKRRCPCDSGEIAQLNANTNTDN